MKYAKIVAAVLVIVVIAALTVSCNIKDDKVVDVLRSAIEKAETDGFSAKFDFTHKILTLYTEKQYNKYYEEAYSTERSLYLYSDDPEENRKQGASRTNWADEDSTEWLSTVYSYDISCSAGNYTGSATVTAPAERNALGEAQGDPIVSAYEDLGYLGNLFDHALSVEDPATYITYQGVKRPGKQIVRVNIVYVLMKDGTYADFSSDGTAKTADGTVVKQAGVEDYNWKAGCGIEKVVIERIDFTIKKNKVTGIEVYSEHISYRKCDQRDYLKAGRIYTTEKAMITETQQTIIAFN